MQLSELKSGQSATVLSLQGGQGAYRKRLIALGLTPGAVVTMRHIAPLGDPVELEIRGVAVCLRKVEAAFIQLGEVVNG